MLYQESQPDRASAARREAAIKKMPRRAKLALIGANEGLKEKCG